MIDVDSERGALPQIPHVQLSTMYVHGQKDIELSELGCK